MSASIKEECDLGEWLYERLTAHYALETEEWAIERVRRITDRLQAARPEAESVETSVLWIPEMTAFTAPGRHAYISRELLQRTEYDDPIALTIAHEIAHHDLGHMRVSVGALSGLRAIPIGLEVAVALKAAYKLFLGPEKES